MKDRQKPRLGKGLSALLSKPISVDPQIHVATTSVRHDGQPPSAATVDPSVPESPLVWLPLSEIVPSQFQPRQRIQPQQLENLAGSIRQTGVIQPIAVRRAPGEQGGKYELVAGERRWRAATLAGLDRVPALIVSLSDRESAEWALVENMQREDLNAMDRAWGLRHLIERFDLTQEGAAARLGLDRASVANLVRLTELEDAIQRLIREGSLSFGHGRALLSLPPGPSRIDAAKRAASESWSVRQTERWVSRFSSAKHEGGIGRATAAQDQNAGVLTELERQLGEHLGSKVQIETNRDRNRGRLIVEFFSVEHFNGLLERLGFEMRS